jgi:spore coat protein U-like protein
LFLAAGLATPQGEATTVTANLAVSASIAGTCSVGAAALGFGSYVSNTASTTTATIGVTCTNGVNATVALGQGNNNGKAAAFGTRALNNGATNFLGYDIFTDGTFATIWNATNTVPVSSTGAVVNLTANAKIPPGQTPTTGSYNDTVQISVTF